MLITHNEESGFPGVVLENDHLRLAFIPQLGSKMISLMNKRTKREWLDRPAGREFRKPDYGSLWGDWDRCGWDEMFPSIDSCAYPEGPWAGIEVPDHGELWPLPWEHEVVDDMTLLFSVHGVRWPYQLQKRVRLENNRIRFFYKLINLSPYPLPYIWAPHPIIAAKPTLKVKFPLSVEKAFVSISSNDWLGNRGSELSWPQACLSDQEVKLDQMPDAGAYYKIYSADPVTEGWCSIEDEATGESFTFTYNAESLPYLGLWVNARGWGGEYHLALEPSSGHLDHLGEARRQGKCSTIQPYAVQRWALVCTIQ
ncbi:DUF4432 family protein [Paenibacillus nasutitermitis]|uniref:DUF5107 domain-containing protein n=1 Tax=Paenibacillus nasutitermitis TaxID=1652958 RepID=A0A916ZJU8_9BACL|nr:DUF4432 family protein [Paenibacillus nasutitermitis]GGE01433.1 hypothetical protein GCM10010911_70390 [Paenibacillus nasutitermitis]